MLNKAQTPPGRGFPTTIIEGWDLSENEMDQTATVEEVSRASKKAGTRSAEPIKCAECGRKMGKDDMLWDYPKGPGEYVTVCEECYIRLCWTPRRRGTKD